MDKEVTNIKALQRVGSFWKWPLLAIQFLTIVPIPNFGSVSERDMRASVIFFPFVGLGLGTIMWEVERLALHMFPPLVSALLALAVLTLMTGMLHLDGFMDLFDALGSRKKGSAALAVMKDSRVGALGASAGMLLLLGKFAALTNLPVDQNQIGLFIFPPMLARLAMIWVMAVAPAATPQQGVGGFYARQLPWFVVLGATVFTFGLALMWLHWQQVLLDGLILVAVVILYALFLTRRFGGMTGDMYGALNELVEWLFFTLGVAR